MMENLYRPVADVFSVEKLNPFFFGGKAEGKE
jgi:hypothetical protein